MSIYSGQRNHTPAPQIGKPLRQLYAPFTKSSEQFHPQFVYFPPPEKSPRANLKSRRIARNSDVYRKLVGRPLILSRGSNYTASLNTRILQLKYNRPSEDCPFGRPKSRLAHALEPPSSRAEAVEHWRTRVHRIFAERQAVGMSFLALQGNPLDSSPIITPLEMFSTTTSPSTNNIPHNPFSLAVPKREPSRPFDHEEAVQSRGISTIPLEQSLSNPFLHSHSQKFPLPSPPMSPVQIHSQPQVNNDKRARRKSISRLGQQQPARAFCTRRPSLRRTSRQSILGKRTMGVSVDPFPSGTEKSPVESSLGDVNGAWDEGGRRMDDSVRFDEDHSFKHIEDLHAPLNPHVRNKSPAFSLLRAYAAPLKINVTVETMTLTTTAAGGHAKSIPTAVDQKPCLPPQLSVPVFSPFSFESLDAFHEPVPSLSYPQPPRTVSSSTSSTPLVTPEASPLLTRGDAHRVGVHSSEGVPRRVENTEPIESLSVEDACPDHLKTGNKEKKKPNLTLDMHAIEGYPTVSRRKGEIVLVRESMGSSRRKNTARTPKHDEAVQNDP